MPEGTVTVTRPSRWGNPFPVGRRVDVWYDAKTYNVQLDVEASLALYRMWFYEHSLSWLSDCVKAREGKDLACWCKLSARCHADFLLEYVNK